MEIVPFRLIGYKHISVNIASIPLLSFMIDKIDAILSFIIDKLLIITHDEEEMIVEDGKEIAVVPIWKWLLEQDSLLENR